MLDKEVVEYYKYLNRLAMIENIINIICFTILAITFKNFWIVFGALLFTTTVKDKKGNKNEQK